MTDVLTTSRLRLRPFVDEDAAPSAALMCEAISQWTGSWKPENTPAEVFEKIRRHRGLHERGDALMCAIERSRDGRLIGWIGVERMDDRPDRAVMGYWLGQSFWGQGYGGEAAGAILDAAWDALGLQSVQAWVQPGNEASIAILKRLGMTFIGARRTFSSARQSEDVCLYFEVRRPPASP